MKKPYAESCDQNREPIFEVIRPLLIHARDVLEIGSGTGQHAVYFARRLDHLVWRCSDRTQNHAGIRQWLDEAGLDNTPAPLNIDVNSDFWPILSVDNVFSANTAHIMSEQEVAQMFSGVGEVLNIGGYFMLYGPFNYEGRYTSESNARFDQWLKDRDPLSGIKHFEDLQRHAADNHLVLHQDNAMPANNRLLVWQQIG
ncbi:MAG: DUF938 domain-containing protein [bacterium]